jgi:polyvinyl alcohol dehydrogenase (cytochrome)
MYGPAGVAVWSAPTIDAKRGLIYFGTGDSYTDSNVDTSDAIIALDQTSGAIRWVRQLTVGDDYIDGCYGPNRPANCPSHLGSDYDFGASPILFTLPNGRQLILAGQKSSQIYALDPDHAGKTVWTHRTSPGGSLGGIQFSIAADESNVYAPVADIYMGPKARPGLYAFRIFAGAMNGRFRAYDTTDGKVIWQFNTASTDVKTASGRLARGGVMDGAGPTIADGMVYVSSGYQGRSGTPGSVLMAFSVDGR